MRFGRTDHMSKGVASVKLEERSVHLIPLLHISRTLHTPERRSITPVHAEPTLPACTTRSCNITPASTCAAVETRAAARSPTTTPDPGDASPQRTCGSQTSPVPDCHVRRKLTYLKSRPGMNGVVDH